LNGYFQNVTAQVTWAFTPGSWAGRAHPHE